SGGCDLTKQSSAPRSSVLEEHRIHASLACARLFPDPNHLIPITLRCTPVGQLLATVGSIGPTFFSRGTMTFSPASSRRPPCVSCVSAGVHRPRSADQA